MYDTTAVKYSFHDSKNPFGFDCLLVNMTTDEVNGKALRLLPLLLEQYKIWLTGCNSNVIAIEYAEAYIYTTAEQNTAGPGVQIVEYRAWPQYPTPYINFQRTQIRIWRWGWEAQSKDVKTQGSDYLYVHNTCRLPCYIITTCNSDFIVIF